MARPKGSKNKKKKVDGSDGFIICDEKARKEIADELLKATPEVLKEIVEVVEPAKVQVKDDPRLPNKSLFRPDEAANYFGYSRSTIYTWIQHGLLKAEEYGGTYRISREAILACRFRSQIDPLV